ncbi:CD44 antigen isoform X2 [Tachyglossus aculeatus]|uniref:CD44 antigen isoform X2 n=1 Tax=Tachyglossus aculeatus TaxID=9261 RepID=UPI0018F31B9B|nr:CD44 antigen isoform X2 [Tachyglossus aculeatus]
MANFFWCATLGLCLVKLTLAQIELNVTCRYAGVYHVEKNGRYSISRIEAEDLCKAFNCTLPTLEQMEKARKIGFQTCRYGFIDGHVVIPRITPNFLCAANNTGVYILPSNTSLYDTYCYNASAPEGVSCDHVTDLPSAFEGQITIGIVNPDGTRYTQKGEYRTHINDTDPTLHPEDDGSSGSETNTQGSSTIIKTTYYIQDSHPVSDFYASPSEWDMASGPATTSMDSTTIQTGLESREESDGSGNFGDDEDDNEHDLFSTTSEGSRTTSQETIWNEGRLQEDPIHTMPEDQPHTTARTMASDTSGGQETTTWSRWWWDVPQGPKKEYHTTTVTTAKDLAHVVSQESTTQKQMDTPGDGSWLGPYSTLEEGHHTTARKTASAHETGTSQEMVTQSEEESWIDWWSPTEHNKTARRMDGNQQDNSTQDPLNGVFHPFSVFEDKSPIPTSTPVNNVSSEVTEVFFPGAPDSREQQTDMSDDRSASQHPTTDPNTSLGEDLVRTEYPQKSTSVDHTRDGNLPDHTTQGPLEDGSPVSTTPMNEEKSPEDPMIFPGYFPSEHNLRHSTSSPNSGLEEVQETTTMHPPTTQYVKGRRGEKLPEDSTQDPSERVLYHSPSTNESETPITTFPSNTLSSGVTEFIVPADPFADNTDEEPHHRSTTETHILHNAGRTEQSTVSSNEDFHQPTKEPVADITNGHGSNEGRKNAEPTTAPRRRPQIPEWLIILASLLALALILAVCIAVNSRRRCGQKKKLVINRSNGAVEERKMSGLNGDASKSQEMVHLVNKEQSDERTGQDEFTVTDETRNLQNVDMKIGM